MVISAIFILILFFISIIGALLFHIAQPIKEDALARMETNIEVLILMYKSVIIVFSTFVDVVIFMLSSRELLIGF